MRYVKLASALTLIGVVLPSPASTASPVRASLPTLARTTTVVGSESATARVRLTRPVHFNKIDAAQLDGDGRAIGFVLAKEENGRIPKDPTVVEFMRFGDCFERACQARHPDDGWGGGGSGGVYPPGTYRLYLIADGAPATVVIHFSELKGKTTITPAGPAKVAIKTPTPQIPLLPTRSLYSAGDVAPFRGNGLTYMNQTLEVPGNGTAAYDYCIYWDEAPALQANAYLPPNCPKGLPQGHRPTVKEYTDAGEEFLGYTLGIYALPAALGSWYATTTPVDAGGSVAVWLKY